MAKPKTFDGSGIARSIGALLALPGGSNFAAQLKAAGVDPKSDLRNTDFSDTEFGDSDITGWNLSGTNLANADLSEVKNIRKAVFSAETKLEGAKLPKGVEIKHLVK